MKVHKLSNKIKLSATLLTAAAFIATAALTVPFSLSTSTIYNKSISNNLDTNQFFDQANNQSTQVVDIKSQPAKIQSFFLNEKTQIFVSNVWQSAAAVITGDDGYDTLYLWGEYTARDDNTISKLGIGGLSTGYTLISLPAPAIGLPAECNITHLVFGRNATTVVTNGNQLWHAGGGYEAGDYSENYSWHFVENRFWAEKSYPPIKSLYGGEAFRILVTEDDQIWAWGDNRFGQLGTDNNRTGTIPINITSHIASKISNWTSGEFVIGHNNTAFIIDKEIYIWGWRSGPVVPGQTLGHFILFPGKPISLPSKIVKIGLSMYSALAILENGDLWGWGANQFGQLGIGQDITTVSPQKIETLSDGTAIANVTNVAIAGTTSFIQIGNKLYSAGNNTYGHLAQDNDIDESISFAPVKLPAGAKVLDFITSAGTLFVNLDSGLYMAGSNLTGLLPTVYYSNTEWPYIPYQGDGKHRPLLTPVPLFSAPTKITSKPDNSSYTADGVIADLTNLSEDNEKIRTRLGKYVDGIEGIPSASLLAIYETPVASPDKDKVTFTLSVGITYNKDGVWQTNYRSTGQILVEITNFDLRNSAVNIIKTPTNAHTGNIQTTLNPVSENALPDLWWNELVDMTRFPADTIFTKIVSDKIIPGADNANGGIYQGNIVPSKYYLDGNEIINTDETSFPFKFMNLPKVADSVFAVSTINPKLNKDNIMTELLSGQEISSEYLPMFVDKDTFPPNTKFRINNPSFDVNKKTYSCILSFDKYYAGGLLEFDSVKNFDFNNLKTIRESQITFTGFKNDNIHSANINELLINNDNSVNIDTLVKLVDIIAFPVDTKFIINTPPALDVQARSYKVTLIADKAYEEWEIVTDKPFLLTFDNITIIENSSIVYRQMPHGYDIENIEESLKNESSINKDVLDKFIKTERFPSKAVFSMGTNNDKDIENAKYDFDLIPSYYYHNGVITENTTGTSYAVTFQFTIFVPPVTPTPTAPLGWCLNIQLLIGLLLFLLALIALIIFLYIKRRELKEAWNDRKAKRQLQQ